MKKNVYSIAILLMSLSGAAIAQNYADNKILNRSSSASARDQYGTSVSLFDNYLLVGTPYDDADASCANIEKSNGGVVLYKDGAPFREYRVGQNIWQAGRAVAMAAEWLAIGAPVAPSSQQGKVFLVKKTNDFGTAITHTIAPTPGPGEGFLNFGYSLAIERNTLVVGDPAGVYNNQQVGLVVVYKLDNGNWVKEATLKAPTVQWNAQFGYAVGLSQDEKKIIIGSPDFDINNKSNVGKAYIFEKGSNGVWAHKTTLDDPNEGQRGYYGVSVDISNSKAIVGSRKPDRGSSIADIHRLDGSTWLRESSVFDTDMFMDVAIDEGKAVLGLGGWPYQRDGRVIQIVNTGVGFWATKAVVRTQQKLGGFGSAVDLRNNFVVVGAAQWDYNDIADNCGDTLSLHDNAGAAFYYNFDSYSGGFRKEEGEAFAASENAENALFVSLSPNPANSTSVEINSNANVLEAVAISAAGSNHPLAIANGKLDIANLTPGLYMVQLKTDKGAKVEKLIVQ